MDTGRPVEVTVIVYRGRGLQGKKKGRGKFNVVFSVGGNKFKSDITEDPSGNPEWNNEAEIPVDNPQEPLILKVKEKDDILGQVVVPLAELPTRRTDRQKCIPLQPHKKCPHPQGELIFNAWISKKSEVRDATADPEPHKQKTSTMQKIKGAMPSPMARRKSEAAPTLQQQTAALQNASGSHASITSAGSSYSTIEKKKSMMKKLKGALSHSPMMKRRMSASMKSTSMMNLAQQQLSVAPTDPELKNSQESLNSQTSANSNQKSSTIGRLKSKLGKSNEMSKKNSQSCTNLAVLDPSMKHAEHHGSNESLKSSKSNKSGKSFKGMFAKKSKSDKSEKPIPVEFDLSKPNNPLFKQPEEEMYGAVPFTPLEDESKPGDPSSLPRTPPKKPPRGPSTSGSSPTQKPLQAATLNIDPENPFNRRNNSLRSRPSLKNRSPALIHQSPKPAEREAKPPPPPKIDSPSSKNRNVFAINADMNDEFDSGLWADVKTSPVAPKKTPSPLAKSKADTEENVESGNPFGEEETETKTTNPFEEEKETTNPFDETEKSEAVFEKMPDAPDPDSAPAPTSVNPPAEETPMSQKKKIAAPFVFSASDDEDDEKKPPEVSGLNPREGSTEGGTKLTIRGEHLGKSKDDIITLTVCGVNCLGSLEYFSQYKIICTTGPRKAGSGKIVIETKSGGLSRSTLDYIFVQPKPTSEPPQKPVRVQPMVQKEKTAVENVQNSDRRAPTPPKEINRNDADTKTAVVEPMSRTQVNKVKLQGRNSNELKRRAPTPPQQTNSQIESSEDESVTREELLRIISNLQSENKKLKEEGQTMKAYIDSLVIRVMEKCPEVLCVQPSF